MEAGQGSSLSQATLTDGTLTFPAYSCGLSLFPPSLPSPPLPFLLPPAPGLRLGRECGWMHGRMDGSHARFLSSQNLRTQLPGETTMTPPPHTQPAHRGPPAGDTLHRAATTAVSKVSATKKLAPTVHTHTHPQEHSIYSRAQA